MEFLEWMKSTDLAEKSAQSYSGAIRGRLTKWALAHGLTTSPIIEISNHAEFSSLSDQLRQTPEFLDRNATGNGMYAAALNNYQRYLIATFGHRNSDAFEFGPHRKELEKLESELPESFTPEGQADARQRVLRAVVQRRGQGKFRKALINAYGGHCAITGCGVIPLLEAAHITPYLGPETNSTSNGLLLRADIHTLWDLGLLAIDPENLKVWVSPLVDDPAYESLSAVILKPPSKPVDRPSTAALLQQWKFSVQTHKHAKLQATN